MKPRGLRSSGDSFDRVLSSVPINASVAKVMGKGVHFEEKTPETHGHWEAPPLMRRHLPDTPTFRDLRGTKQGELTALGVLAAPGELRWVVRCVCGDYEVRSAKALTNPKNNEDRCIECKRTYYFREGRGPNAHHGTPRPRGYVSSFLTTDVSAEEVA